jgi:hypothetical protein
MYAIKTPALVILTILALSALIIRVAPGQSDSESSEGKTVVLQKLTYGPDGTVLVDEIGRHTWRSDGSASYDAVVSVSGKGSARTRAILDVSSQRRSDLFFELGLKLVTALPKKAAEGVRSVTGETCEEFAARTGEQEGADVYKRRVQRPDGTTSIRLYSPKYNCEVIEAQLFRGSNLLYEVRTLSQLNFTDEALFEVDPNLRSASRVEIAAEHEKKYGQPMFADPRVITHLEELDARVPSIR